MRASRSCNPPPHPRRPGAGLAAAAAALALPLLGGCGGNGAAPPPSSDVGRVSSSAVRHGGTLTWAVDAVPKTLNVHQSDAGAATRTVADATLPVLFPQDRKGVPHADHDFVTRTTVRKPTRHGAGQTVVYTLNPKARWSDGKPLSAADFAGQWKALRGSDPAYWSDGSGGYHSIASVHAGPHAHQVTVRFKKPFAEWRALFSPLYPAAATASPSAFNDGLRHTLPATAGPFRLHTVDADAGTVTLDRDPHWWGHRAHLDHLVLRAVPKDRRLAALRSGKVDVAPVDLDRTHPEKLLRGIRKDDRLTLHKAAGSAWTQLTLNGGSGPLSDPALRRAVARAVDREEIARDVNKPLGLSGYAPGSHLVMAGRQGYTDNSSALGSVETDGKAVKQALKASGSADGKAPELRVLIPKGSPQAATVASDVVRMLRRVGLSARPVAVPGESFFTDHVAQGTFDLAVFSWPDTAFPLVDARSLYAKPRPAADGDVNVGRNYARTGTDEIDLLFRKAGQELDPEKAKELTDVLDARIWREAVSLPLYQRPEAVATRRNVANAGVYGPATPDFAALGFTRK